VNRDAVNAYMRRPSQRIASALRHRAWNDIHNEGTWRNRVYSAFSDRRSWWDWGHPLMALSGRPFCGSWDVPRGRDLWFRYPDHHGNPAWLATHPEVKLRCGLLTTTDYATVRDTNDGEWRIFDWQDDGYTIRIGYWPAPDGDGRIHDSGIDGRREIRLFLRWLVWDGLGKAEWFGLRRWAYYKALNQVVHDRKPFTCQQVPARDSGGYQHWHCQLRRRHTGPHRFRAMVWADGGRVERQPLQVVR
jgi:hypothetical protein